VRIDPNRPFEPDPLPLPERCPQCGLATVSEHPFCKRCDFDLLHGVLRKNSVRGKCLYCGAVGDLTDEHIYGKWVPGHFGRSGGQRMHELARPVKSSMVVQVPMRQNKPRIERKDIYDGTVRNVCERCNNTWMSDIHKAAAPLVKMLAAGDWPDFTPEEQKALVRWAVVVAINREFMAGQVTTMIYQLKALMNGDVPDGWFVSICRQKGPASAGFSRHQHFVLQEIADGAGIATLQNIYFCIEKVFFHCLVFPSHPDHWYWKTWPLVHRLPLETIRNIWPDNESREKAQHFFLTWNKFEQAFSLTTVEIID